MSHLTHDVMLNLFEPMRNTIACLPDLSARCHCGVTQGFAAMATFLVLLLLATAKFGGLPADCADITTFVVLLLLLTTRQEGVGGDIILGGGIGSRLVLLLLLLYTGYLTDTSALTSLRSTSPFSTAFHLRLSLGTATLGSLPLFSGDLLAAHHGRLSCFFHLWTSSASHRHTSRHGPLSHTL